MESNPKPSGICQKLDSLFLGTRTTPEGLHGLSEIPIEEASSRNNKSFNGSLGSEIKVHFRHVDDSGRSIQIDEWNGSIRAPEKDGLVLIHEKTIMQKGLEKKDETDVPVSTRIDQKTWKSEQGFNGTDTRGEGVKKEVGVLPDQVARMNNRANQDIERRPARLGSFLSINKRFDTFIQRKKDGMRRNYSLDPEKS